MRIRIREGGTRFTLPLPNRVVFSHLTARLLSRAAAEGGVDLPSAQLLAFFRALRRYRRAHPGFALVEVRTKDGGLVEIRL